MLFLGEYEHVIDAKQRLAIPAEVRDVFNPEQHGSAFIAVPGGDGSLWLWPERTCLFTASWSSLWSTIGKDVGR